MTTGKQLLVATDLSKRYGGVHALRSVQFDLNYGEVHALVGENGAGKSTLVKCIGGVVRRDGGTIQYEGKQVDFNSPLEAKHAGIAIIHQELCMMPSVTVIENLFMGRMRSRAGLLNWRQMEADAYEAMARVDLHVDPHAIVRELSISQRQMIEIARAVSANARLIFMDEPNSSLSESETERLFEVIETLKADGIGIVYVSHKIDEVLRISDRITVFRDGGYVGTLEKAEATDEKVINMMVGRDIDRSIISVPKNIGDTLLEVRGLTSDRFTDVSFDLRKGEIIGFAGLVGAGRSEVLRAIFGADSFKEGTINFDGKPVKFSSPRAAITAGMAMVPEDRKVLSLFMGMQIKHNMSMAELPDMSPVNLIQRGVEQKMVDDLVEQLDIRLETVENPVSSLSGGNQQKTVLARWLATNPKLLILDEPTHGVDVGAKAEIYDLMRQLAEAGMGIVLISSELPEIMTLPHRIVVMHEGRVTAILNRDEATEESIMAYATGLADEYTGEPADEKVEA
jgi:ABC-type sugar transport system ATPase subunit